MNDILTILKKIYSPIQIQASSCKNERYLHHYFSHELQLKKYPIICGDTSKNLLHPEWPTKKKEKNNGIGGTYKHDKDKRIRIVDKNGYSGFIDFAIGDYDKPEIAIEFTVSSGWEKEAVIYDMMKLMDSRNPFQKVISYNIVFRKGNLPGEVTKTFTDFKNAINHSLTVYKERLENSCVHNRKYLFWVIEIGNNQTRSWYCSNFDGVKSTSPKEFKMGDPV
jgi:hypothetical protein